ncbi:unnamed protein product [Rotaria sordida]|uniref:Uncharacterized protein n=1 Tax=Rotaria sordida TaxID=392033 RepID=A0A815N969_9BILA|nr:unnamed protein product [Rotaria sordida]
MIQIEDKRLTILIATTGVTSDQLPSSQNNEDQTQPPSSAMFTLWNLIADLVDTQNLKENQQQQIMDFYAKAGTIVPRLACLVQLFLNCMQILEQMKDFVVFSEGTCIEQTNNRDQPTTMIFHAPASKVTSQTTTPVKVNTFTDIVEESSVTQHHCCIEVLSNQQDINITQKSPPEHNNSFETIHNFSAMSCEQIDNVEHNSSHILVQPIVREIDEINVEGEASTSIPQSPHLKNYEKKTTNNNTQNIEKQMPHDEEEEVVHTRSQPARRKRKAETDENYGEHPQTRTQTRKLRRN